MSKKHLFNEQLNSKHFTQDQKAMILKTYDYKLNALSDIDEILLSAVFHRLKVAINSEDEPNGKY